MPEQLKDPQRRVVGTKQVLRAVADNRAAMVYLGKDADNFLYHRVKGACEEKGVSVNTAYTMSEIGTFCVLDVPSAAAAVLK